MADFSVTADLTVTPSSIKASSKQIQGAFNNLQIDVGKLDKFENKLGRITGQASEFSKSLDAATARVFAFGATVSVLNSISQAFDQLVSSTIEVERRLIEINSIFGLSSEGLNNFREEIFQVAANTGQAFSTVADAATELARQGLGAAETTERLNNALILTRVSGLDSVSAVEAVTAAINGFTSANLDSAAIINKVIAVDTAFAVSSRDLAEAFQRAGSTAEDAGVSFDELLGIVTAVQQRTSRGGAVIGNALKSIFTRLGRSTTIEELQKLGVAIDASQSGVQKLEALSQALTQITDPTVANQIKELAGGVFQVNIVSAALKDLSSETSIFAQAAKTANTATTEGFEKNAELSKSLASNINALFVSLTNVASKIGDLTIAPALSNVVEAVSFVSQKLSEALDPEQGNKLIQGFFKAIGTFLTGPGLVLITSAFAKIFFKIIQFAKEGVSEIFKIGGALQQQKQIEQGILQLLQEDASLRAVLTNQATSLAQKEQAVINAIQRENQLLQQQKAILDDIAKLAISKGVTGFKPSKGFTGTFATGYIPNFETAAAVEVAQARQLGATSTVKAKKSKGTIGGKKFVMNSQEVEIPRFGKNGDSAVIPLYAKGFVPNFVSVYELAKRKLEELQNTTNLSSGQRGTITKFKNLERSSSGFSGIDPSSLDEREIADLKQRASLIKVPEGSKGTQSPKERGAFPKPVNFDIDTQGKIGVLSVYGGQTDSASTSSEFSKIFGKQQIGLIDKNLRQSRIGFRNIQVSSLEGLNANPDKFLTKLNQEVVKILPSIFAGSPFADILGNQGPKPSDIASALSSQRKVLDAATEGYLFELATRFATSQDNKSFIASIDNSDKSPFDFEESGEVGDQFKKAFNFKDALQRADAKRTADKNSISTLIKKALNQKVLGSSKKIEKDLLDDIPRSIFSNNAKEYEEARKRLQEAIRNGRAVGYIPNFAKLAYDSDQLDPQQKKEFLSKILTSKKKKELLLGPSGVGKTTFAEKGGAEGFIKSVGDIQKASEILIISGASQTKAGGLSPQLEQLIASVKSSGGKLKYLYKPNLEISQQRNKRIDQAKVKLPDKRSFAALKGAKNAPLNKYPFIKQLKERGFEIVRAAEGYIPNFEQPSSISKAIQSLPSPVHTPLQDAISREKSAGLKASQIRVDSDRRLINKGNPLGLAVTNTRDEPRGLKNVFAKGHIPNFADLSTTTFGKELKLPIDGLRDLQFALKEVKSGLLSANDVIQYFKDDVDKAGGTVSTLVDLAKGAEAARPEAKAARAQFSPITPTPKQQQPKAPKFKLSPLLGSNTKKSEAELIAAIEKRTKSEEGAAKGNKDMTGKLIGLSSALFTAQTLLNTFAGEGSKLSQGIGAALNGFNTLYAILTVTGKDLGSLGRGVKGAIKGISELTLNAGELFSSGGAGGAGPIGSFLRTDLNAKSFGGGLKGGAKALGTAAGGIATAAAVGTAIGELIKSIPGVQSGLESLGESIGKSISGTGRIEGFTDTSDQIEQMVEQAQNLEKYAGRSAESLREEFAAKIEANKATQEAIQNSKQLSQAQLDAALAASKARRDFDKLQKILGGIEERRTERAIQQPQQETKLGLQEISRNLQLSVQSLFANTPQEQFQIDRQAIGAKTRAQTQIIDRTTTDQIKTTFDEFIAKLSQEEDGQQKALEFTNKFERTAGELAKAITSGDQKEAATLINNVPAEMGDQLRSVLSEDLRQRGALQQAELTELSRVFTEEIKVRLEEVRKAKDEQILAVGEGPTNFQEASNIGSLASEIRSAVRSGDKETIVKLTESGELKRFVDYIKQNQKSTETLSQAATRITGLSDFDFGEISRIQNEDGLIQALDDLRKQFADKGIGAGTFSQKTLGALQNRLERTSDPQQRQNAIRETLDRFGAKSAEGARPEQEKFIKNFEAATKDILQVLATPDLKDEQKATETGKLKDTLDKFVSGLGNAISKNGLVAGVAEAGNKGFQSAGEARNLFEAVKGEVAKLDLNQPIESLKGAFEQIQQKLIDVAGNVNSPTNRIQEAVDQQITALKAISEAALTEEERRKQASQSIEALSTEASNAAKALTNFANGLDSFKNSLQDFANSIPEIKTLLGERNTTTNKSGGKVETASPDATDE